MPTFSHRFADDLQAIDWFGEPFALARFADGELACIEGRAHDPYGSRFGTETWSGSGPMPLRAQLRQSLEADLEGYYLGLSPMCCQGACAHRLGTRVNTPPERRVAATLFSYGNHVRFHELEKRLELRKRSVLVSGKGGDLQVPLDAINHEDWLEPLLEKLLAVRGKPILVAAGPAACVLVHQYWLRAEEPQVIVDIGSVLDEQLHGRGTRMHTAGPDRVGMRFHDCKLHLVGACHPGCKPSRF